VRFAEPLVRGTLILREKRFLAHVRLDSGDTVVAHTNNSGRMTGCSDPGSVVWLSPADKPGRKLKWTWEIVHVGPNGVSAGINTILPNKLVAEAIAEGRIPQLPSDWKMKPEARYGEEGSRVDLLLSEGQRRIWVEVKNVTLVRDGAAAFPDAPTARGRKHLRELSRQVAGGDRAVLVFVVQRGDASSVGPAEDIDPGYGVAFKEAVDAGVEILAWSASVTPEEIRLSTPLPVRGA
jgi:sugar fermentation stimulation protein A